MIKQIQLRGISRTPSDRMTADGGCAESLNVHLADNELSPTLAPEDITGELGLPENATKGYIYIHKGNGYINYITLEGVELGAYVDGNYERIAYMEQDETLQSATSVGNTIVIMGSSHPYYALFKNKHYIFLGNKIPMPTIQITPEPVNMADIEYPDNTLAPLQKLHWRTFFKVGYDDSSIDPVDSRPNNYYRHTSPDPALENLTIDSWNSKASEAEEKGKRYAGREDATEADPDQGTTEEWDLMTGMREYATLANQVAKHNKFLYHQTMMLYGVRLYNNAYITSVPVLLPGGFECPYICRYLRYKRSINWNKEAISFMIRYPYKVKAKLVDFDEETISLWSDIIMSIDFFMTPTIPFDVSQEKVAYAVREFAPSIYSTDSYTYDGATYNLLAYNYFEIRPCSNKYHNNYIKRVLSNGSDMFRKAISLSTDIMAFDDRETIARLRDGDVLKLDDYIEDQDLLLSQEALADFSYDMKNTERVAKETTTINNRLLLAGVTETINSGAPFFPAAPCVLYPPEGTGAIPYIEESYRYDVQVNYIPFSITSLYNKEATYSVFKSDFTFPQNKMYVQIVYNIQGSESYTVRGRIGRQGSLVASVENLGYFGFLIFPDKRCKSADIYVSYNNIDWYKKTYEMREHPRFDCSYLYVGADKNIIWDVIHAELRYDNRIPSYQDYHAGLQIADMSQVVEKRVEHKDNALLLSDVDNPWFFPLENQYQIQATEIIGTALATKALSTGQFGQFPLYVFTDNGIWAMQMDSLGTFSSSHAVSRDVAKKNTILSLDQAVVFLSDKGVMLLTGSDLQNLSPNMNGRHYTVEADAGELIGRSDWSALLGAITDGSHFMSFMENASPAYDYAGERIVFFNKAKSYMYVYMLRTATWHKATMPERTEVDRLLNSYPDTYVAVKQTVPGSSVKWARILDFSTMLDVTSGENGKAVIVTRPIDLGEPDIRKTIKSIRIRGQYNRNDVKYILLGSMDGLNWGVLPSLRGGSYKWYRLVILASLSPTERISWIDIDYESRFTNKLR